MSIAVLCKNKKTNSIWPEYFRHNFLLDYRILMILYFLESLDPKLQRLFYELWISLSFRRSKVCVNVADLHWPETYSRSKTAVTFERIFRIRRFWTFRKPWNKCHNFPFDYLAKFCHSASQKLCFTRCPEFLISVLKLICYVYVVYDKYIDLSLYAWTWLLSILIGRKGLRSTSETRFCAKCKM